MPDFVAFETLSFLAELGIFSLLFGISFLDFGRVNLHRYYIIIPFVMSRFGWDIRVPLGLFGAEIIVPFWP
jgi:hypothetical protein